VTICPMLITFFWSPFVDNFLWGFVTLSCK